MLKQDPKYDKADYITSSKDIQEFVKGYKEAKILIEQRSKKLDLNSFSIKVRGKYIPRVISVYHCDGSCLEFHSACFEKCNSDFFFVFTEHHGNFVYHREDVKSISTWGQSGGKKAVQFGILYPMEYLTDNNNSMENNHGKI
jgi:hypothetical protein